MQPADQALVQKCLSAALHKVAAMKKNLATAQHTLKQQEQALYSITHSSMSNVPGQPIVEPPVQKSASILDGDVDMQDINNAIKRLTAGCECPNVSGLNIPPNKEGG